MVGTTVTDQMQHASRARPSCRRGSRSPRARRGADEDFDSLPSQISVRHLDFFYGKEQALFDNEIEIKKNRVTAVIGPSGCGKSTHIRTYNRIFNLYRDQKATRRDRHGRREHPVVRRRTCSSCAARSA